MITETILSASFLLHACLGGALKPAAPRADLSAGVPHTSEWKTVAAAGRVETRPEAAAGDLWLPLRRGHLVAPLSRVRTFERARATLTRHGDLVLIDAGSEVVLPDETEEAGTVVLQRTGNAIYRVAPRDKGRRFEVRTPFLVAGVKGTRFSIQITENDAAVSVLEGIVEVRSLLTGEAEDLTAGQVAVVERQEGRMELHIEPGGSKEAPSAVDEALVIRAKSRHLDADLRKAQALMESADLDLWGDLSDDTTTLTRTTSTDSTKTTRTLNSTCEDLKSDTTLIDAVPLLRKRN